MSEQEAAAAPAVPISPMPVHQALRCSGPQQTRHACGYAAPTPRRPSFGGCSAAKPAFSHRRRCHAAPERFNASAPPRLLFFDVMDTVVSDPFYSTMPAHFGLSFPELMAAKHPTAWVDFELGLLDEAAFLASFFKDGRRVDGAALRAAMRGAYAFLPGMEGLLSRLATAGNEMHCFSNYPVWFQLVEERCQLSRYMSWTAVSCLPDIAARKPDARAFEAAARAAGGGEAASFLLVVRHIHHTSAACPLTPPQDDRAVNVEAARKAGWQGVLFEGAAALELELRRLGVPGA